MDALASSRLNIQTISHIFYVYFVFVFSLSLLYFLLLLQQLYDWQIFWLDIEKWQLGEEI